MLSPRNLTRTLFVFVLLLPLIAACTSDDPAADPTPTDVPGTEGLGTAPAATAISTPAPVASPMPAQATPMPRARLTAAELLKHKPNELGSIPIFMYHNIVSDPSLEGHLYRTTDEFYDDLTWLYDHNFSLIGMNEMVRGRIDAPAGKHPAVLTFDDSSSMHLSFEMDANGQPVRDANGNFVPTPNCAVGIMEQFKRDHPGFRVTAHFAIIPSFKFSWPDWEQDDLFAEKLQWLLDHGYEVGNHTLEHPELNKVSTSDFARNIADPLIMTSDMVDPNHPYYAFTILTLPYGAHPEEGWSGDKYLYLTQGYVWNGHPINIEGALLVCCGPSPSPYHNGYDRLWIPRIAADDPEFAGLESQIQNGSVVLFTSDGNPDTVTVPWPLPERYWHMLNHDALAILGLELVKYHPETGELFARSYPTRRLGYNWEVWIA